MTNRSKPPSSAPAIHTFSAILRIIGLSQKEAGQYLTKKLRRDVTTMKIKNMCTGRTQIDQDIMDALHAVYIRQSIAVDNALDLLDELTEEHDAPAEIHFSSIGRSNQWPSQRVAENVAALIQLESGYLPD